MRPRSRRAAIFALALAWCAGPVPVSRADEIPPPVTFPVRPIRLDGHRIVAEIADVEAARERGLMLRTALADGHGMLFVFEAEFPLGFWMKNTLIPLSIGYLDDSKTLIDVQEMVPATSGDQHPPVYRSPRPARYALEMPRGWFKRKNVKIGARLAYEPAGPPAAGPKKRR